MIFILGFCLHGRIEIKEKGRKDKQTSDTWDCPDHGLPSFYLSFVFLIAMVYDNNIWTIKKAERWRINDFELWCWRRLLRVPWTAGRFNQSILKEISPGCLGRTDVEAEIPILWPPDAKSWLIWKDPDSGKDWGQEEKGMTEDEMFGWHDWLNGDEFE